MKKPLKIVCMVSAGITLFVLIRFGIAAAINVASLTNHSHSVAIIGGADGPTALYLTQQLASQLLLHQPLFWVGIVSFAVFLATFSILIIQRFCKR
jgi:Na+-transporting methylmalonyl-CoA/oxaloacetate decarboxylase beta subunit